MDRKEFEQLLKEYETVKYANIGWYGDENNDVEPIHTQGLAEGIYCAMCTNTMKSDTGCDGGCHVNKEMYNKVMTVIEKQMVNETRV